MTRCAIYIRLSKKDKTESCRLAFQRKYLPEYARSQVWSYEVFDEGEKSASDIHKLPKLNELLSRLNEFQIVLAIEYTRFSRDVTLQDYIWFLHQCTQAGIKLATPQSIFDTRDPDQWFSLYQAGGFSGREIRWLVKRANQGRKEKRDKGGWLGGQLPTGYRYNQIEKRIEIESREVDLVRTALALSVDRSVSEVARQLIEFRSRLGNRVTQRWVRRTLEPGRLLFYSGQTHDSQGRIIRGQQPPIISEELRQEIFLAKHQRNANPAHSTQAKYLLTGLGIFRCGYCGRSVKSHKGNLSRRFMRNYYFCSAIQEVDPPDHPRACWEIDFIDGKVTNDLISRFQTPKLIREAFEETKLKKDMAGEEVEKVTQKLKRKELYKKRLINALEELDDDPDIVEKIREVSSEIQGLWFTVNNLQGETFPQLTLDQFKQEVKKIENFESKSFQEKREVLSTTVKKVRLFRDRLEIDYNFPIKSSRIELPARP